MLVFLLLLLATLAAAQTPLTLRISWGHRGTVAKPYIVRLQGAGISFENTTGVELEPTEGLRDGSWRTTAGAGDVDGVECRLRFEPREPVRIPDLHIIWADLIAHSDPDTVRRLTGDPAYRIDGRKLTVMLDEAGQIGFSVTVDQLLRNPAIWIPSLDVYLASGDTPPSFSDHMRALVPYAGKRIIDELHAEPEATYEQYAARWENMGDPDYRRPNQRPPGHIICITWDSAIPKFGIDRGGGIWNDYGNPDRFRLWPDFADLTQTGLTGWRGQRLDRGLPIVTTMWEREGVRYEIEQFAYPMDGPPAERRGDLQMVLCERIRMTELTGRARSIPLTFYHERSAPRDDFRFDRHGSDWMLSTNDAQSILLDIKSEGEFPWSGVKDYQKELKRVQFSVPVDLPAHGTRDVVLKLPSPALDAGRAQQLGSLDYDHARQATAQFWTDLLARGARFEVPDPAVNELYRANLWHALRLPRRHGAGPDPVIDLPYSNFAYAQTGTPWPVNQAVYVDYMLYDLRGYHAIATEELAAIYRNNQEPDGHVKGFANWLVYTPSMLYAVAKNYALSGDRAALDKLLPQSLHALDWCLAELRDAEKREGPGQGLVNGPLNDGTGRGLWAFNQAYFYAGLNAFAGTLEAIGHPSAAQVRQAAANLLRATSRAFHEAAVRSPLVELRDHAWMPYVPAEATTYGRLMNIWYPTDVDTGALHLVRLNALPPNGDLAGYLLNDHEDNLFLHGWGVANEPVYNQNATAHLLRDDPVSAIRAFYSMMASGFSQSVFEPVEHRWMHGQYFGPPSTDGAWAELYRNMLVRETSGATLLLAQATPRRWLEDGRHIRVERAPTEYGLLSFQITSRTSANEIEADVTMPQRKRPAALIIRLRHPDAKRIQSVLVNGRTHLDFDPQKEWIQIKNPTAQHYTVIARY
jgi:hypothetical protein